VFDINRLKNMGRVQRKAKNLAVNLGQRPHFPLKNIGQVRKSGINRLKNGGQLRRKGSDLVNVQSVFAFPAKSCLIASGPTRGVGSL
jgi:hypothetical protein